MTEVDLDAAIYVPGPWKHRDIAAHGARFHVVEAGTGPAVVLLHGFPTFWWTWRRQLQTLADAGYRAIAMDLRGYAGSDHPPDGYDPITLSADVEGVLRSLGVDSAVIVGHGWGGFIAWSMAVTQRHIVRGIAPTSMPHPRALRGAALRNRHQLQALRYAASWQLPFWPEHALQAKDGIRVEQLLHQWSATPDWPDAQTSARYRAVFGHWPTAHTAVEYHRWAVRSLLRPDGLRFMRQMSTPIDVPVLHMHGARDPMIPPSSCSASASFVSADYRFELLDAGHFVHEENPAQFDDVLLAWLN